MRIPDTSASFASPEDQRSAVIEGFSSHDLRNNLPESLLGLVGVGQCFSWDTVGSAPEGMTGTTVSLTPLARTSVGANGYPAAIEAGLIPKGADYTDYSRRPAVVVESGPHGRKTFAYDAETGIRFWPPGDVADLDRDRANRLGLRRGY